MQQDKIDYQQAKAYLKKEQQDEVIYKKATLYHEQQKLTEARVLKLLTQANNRNSVAEKINQLGYSFDISSMVENAVIIHSLMKTKITYKEALNAFKQDIDTKNEILSVKDKLCVALQAYSAKYPARLFSKHPFKAQADKLRASCMKNKTEILSELLKQEVEATKLVPETTSASRFVLFKKNDQPLPQPFSEKEEYLDILQKYQKACSSYGF
jgi:hypothetical protein